MAWWRSRGTGRCGERKQGKRQEHMRVGKHMTKRESNHMLGPKSLYDVYTVLFSLLHFSFQNLIIVSKLNQSLSSIHLFSHTCHHTSVHDWNLKIKHIVVHYVIVKVMDLQHMALVWIWQ